MHLNELVHILIKDALRIKENEVIEVTLTGDKHYFDFIDEFTLQLAKRGAFPTIRLNTPSYRKRYLKEVPEKYLARTPPQALKRIMDFHRHINVIFNDPEPRFDGISTKRYRILAEAKRAIVEKIKQRNLSVIYLPTPELAKYFNIPEDIFIPTMFDALNISYKRLRKQCSNIAQALKKSNGHVRIITEDQFELRFKLADRPIFSEDGTHNIPAGSTFVSPVESSVNGSILLNSVFLDGKVIKNLILNFKNGRINSSSADRNHSVFTHHLKEAYGDKDVFAGFGFGLNPGLQKPIGCDVLDKRCMGTVHACLGSNLIFGGNNFSDIFITLVQPGATVFLDDTKILDHGKLAEHLTA